MDVETLQKQYPNIDREELVVYLKFQSDIA